MLVFHKRRKSMFNREWYLEQWQKCKILGDSVEQHKSVASLIIKFRAGFYDFVEAKTGVPWYVVGALDCRESDFDHQAYLGNGDPLNKPTHDVPRGRGPFPNWSTGAVDALILGGWDKLPPGGHWDIVTALIKLESFNGEGYAHMGLPSPYVWAGTNIEKPGKYTSDGHFDPHAIDHQPGCAAILLTLRDLHGVDLNEK
jgi:lysozyme family protein